ncbi:MAG TPA: hypothetical protein VEA78_01915 [Acidimicrobiales bacterium]|nr:hypothetical protein [Acidimicrobiales bacterium]
MRRLPALVLLAGSVVACADDGPPSTEAERRVAAGELVIGSPPTSYRITYEVEHDTGDRTSEVLEGRPPFDVRLELLDADGELADLGIYTFGAIETGSPSQDRAALVAHPGVPDAAAVISGDVTRLLEEGVVEDLGEAATVAERDCRFLRVEEDEDGHRDVCVDDIGLVLHEEVVRDGTIVQRRHAIDVEVDVRLEDDAFDPLGARLPENLGGGRVRRMTSDSRFPDVDFAELGEVPSGMRFAGRYVVAEDVEVDSAGVPGARTVALADVYEGSGELLVVENVRSTTAGAPGLATDVGIPWEVDGFDDVRLLLSFGRSELRTANVRVIGTGSVDTLVEVFESLVVASEPGETVPFDDDVVDVLDEVSPR